MDRAGIAEGVLSIVAGHERAGEVIGDLLEARPNLTEIRFWAAIMRLFLAFCWRSLIGFVAAMVVGIYSWFPLSTLLSRHHSPSAAGLYQVAQCVNVSILLWALAAFAFIRFGIGSKLFLVSVLNASLAGAFAYCLWMPQARIALFAGVTVVLCCNLSSDKMRRAFGAMAIALALGLATGGLLLSIHEGPHSLISKWPVLLAVVCVPLVEITACSLLRKRLFDMEQEPG